METGKAVTEAVTEIETRETWNAPSLKAFDARDAENGTVAGPDGSTLS